MKSQWSKFMEQVTSDYLVGVDKDGVSLGGFVEIGRNMGGAPTSIRSAQQSVHWTLRLWAWLKNILSLGLRQ